jgi:hypothetical protein
MLLAMNIFALDENPVLAAQYQCNAHVVKMVLESAQMLSTYCHIKNLNEPNLYKRTHINHPCQIWLHKNESNVKWLIEHAYALSDEYTFRYKKVHKSLRVISFVDNLLKIDSPSKDHSPFVLVMPEQYRNSDCIKAYRDYYMGDKRDFARWTVREIPSWWV